MSHVNTAENYIAEVLLVFFFFLSFTKWSQVLTAYTCKDLEKIVRKGKIMIEGCVQPFQGQMPVSLSYLTLSFIYTHFKGGYLEFSHLTELENKHIAEINMKKQYKSSIMKNYKITHTKKLMVFPYKAT